MFEESSIMDGHRYNRSLSDKWYYCLDSNVFLLRACWLFFDLFDKLGLFQCISNSAKAIHDFHVRSSLILKFSVTYNYIISCLYELCFLYSPSLCLSCLLHKWRKEEENAMVGREMGGKEYEWDIERSIEKDVSFYARI